jgi:hypothetical protein
LVCLGGGLKKRDLEIGVQVVGLARNLRSLAVVTLVGGGWCYGGLPYANRTSLSQTQTVKLCAVLCLVSLLAVFPRAPGETDQI